MRAQEFRVRRLAELPRRHHGGEHGNLGAQLHVHQRLDHGVGDELVAVDAAIDHEARRDDRGVAPGLGEQLRVQGNLERARHLEHINLGPSNAARFDLVEEGNAALLHHVAVPGSFEIPLHVQLLAKTRRYTAIVAAGLVVDGGIYRHEFVADTVIKALMDVQLRTEVPVFSAVLTPQQFHESSAHVEFFRKHFATKGIEVAEACANTLLSLERLRGQVAAGIV